MKVFVKANELRRTLIGSKGKVSLFFMAEIVEGYPTNVPKKMTLKCVNVDGRYTQTIRATYESPYSVPNESVKYFQGFQKIEGNNYFLKLVFDGKAYAEKVGALTSVLQPDDLVEIEECGEMVCFAEQNKGISFSMQKIVDQGSPAAVSVEKYRICITAYASRVADLIEVSAASSTAPADVGNKSGQVSLIGMFSPEDTSMNVSAIGANSALGCTKVGYFNITKGPDFSEWEKTLEHSKSGIVRFSEALTLETARILSGFLKALDGICRVYLNAESVFVEGNAIDLNGKATPTETLKVPLAESSLAYSGKEARQLRASAGEDSYYFESRDLSNGVRFLSCCDRKTNTLMISGEASMATLRLGENQKYSLPLSEGSTVKEETLVNVGVDITAFGRALSFIRTEQTAINCGANTTHLLLQGVLSAEETSKKDEKGTYNGVVATFVTVIRTATKTGDTAEK